MYTHTQTHMYCLRIYVLFDVYFLRSYALAHTRTHTYADTYMSFPVT